MKKIALESLKAYQTVEETILLNTYAGDGSITFDTSGIGDHSQSSDSSSVADTSDSDDTSDSYDTCTGEDPY